MRVLDGERTLVRIFAGEGDRWGHQPLTRALLERLRAEGFAGATVIHGIAGFGASSVIHTASLVELSTDLPVLIEIVEDEAHVERLLPILDEMLTGGALVTVEKVRVLKYAPGPPRPRQGPNAA
jgi:PII-like signaling protein